MENLELQKNIEITYDGELNYIDADTFLLSQFNLIAIIAEIHKDIFPDHKFNIKIQALKRGSFEVELMLLSAYSVSLFNNITLDKVVDVFTSLIALGILLKGKMATKTVINGDQVNITNIHNNNITIPMEAYELYTKNESISSALKKNFDALKKDEEVVSLIIKDKNNDKEIVKIERHQFDNFIVENEYLLNTKKFITKKARLYIRKIDFATKENSVNWEFQYAENKIKAKIISKEFLNTINAGERFSKGDGLDVLLNVEMMWSDEFKVYEGTGRYEIIEVYRIIRRDEEPPLFEED